MPKLALQRDLPHNPDTLQTDENYIEYIHNLRTYFSRGNRAWLRNELAKQIRTTSSSSAGLHTAELGTNPDNCSPTCRRTSPIGLDLDEYYDYTVYRNQGPLHAISTQTTTYFGS
eukprot:1004376-Amphidinium_carterae.1